jgi:hypothetical protein
MSEWRPIETLPIDGELRLFWTPLGGCMIAPATKAFQFTRAQVVKIAKDTGALPHKGWNPTHWMPLPAPPKEAQRKSDYDDAGNFIGENFN